MPESPTNLEWPEVQGLELKNWGRLCQNCNCPKNTILNSNNYKQVWVCEDLFLLWITDKSDSQMAYCFWTVTIFEKKNLQILKRSRNVLLFHIIIWQKLYESLMIDKCRSERKLHLLLIWSLLEVLIILTLFI